VQIAKECQPSDVVISSDSDLLLYSSVNTVWRPVTKTKLLVYNIQDVTKTLGITRQQLTALGVVSRNDYTRIIPSLGCATNFGIVKQLKGHGEYLW
jgi:5'-3' exonuclease